MNWTLWMMFVLTEGALTVTPGPAVLFVVSQGLRSRPVPVLWSAVGIVTANALFFALSGTSLAALLVASRPLFTTIQWGGAGYLLYLGARAFLASTKEIKGGLPEGESDCHTLFLRGFFLQLSNPKAVLFFVAILPQFITRDGPIVFQVFVFGITSILLELVVLTAYGLAAARAARVAITPRFAVATSRVSGALLIGAALALVRLER